MSTTTTETPLAGGTRVRITRVERAQGYRHTPPSVSVGQEAIFQHGPDSDGEVRLRTPDGNHGFYLLADCITPVEDTPPALTVGQTVTIRNPRRPDPFLLDHRVRDGMTGTVRSLLDREGEVLVEVQRHEGGNVHAHVLAECLIPVEAEEAEEAEEVPPLEAEARCATTYVSEKDRRHLLLRPGTKITYFPDMPWWSITPYDMDASRMLVLVDKEGEADGYYNEQTQPVEELLGSTVMDEAPAGLRGRRGILVQPWRAMQALTYNNTQHGAGMAYVIRLEWLPHLTPTADVYEPVGGKTDPSGTRSIVLSPKPLARRQQRVDGSVIHRFRLDGRVYGWYWTTVPTILLNHATERETLDQDNLVEALHQLQREVEQERAELEEAIVDAAVYAVDSNGADYRESTVELLESLGLDSSRIGPRRRRVTSRVTIEIEVEGYVDDEDADVDNYEVQGAVDYTEDSEGHICISFDEGYFDGGLVYSNVISVDAHSTDYSEETVD